MAEAVKNPVLVLNSWKGIASYLDRGVRTAQRWERELQLPVHRIGKGKRSPVYALPAELKFWLISSGVESTISQRAPLKLAGNGAGNPNSLIETSRRLVSESHNLVRSIAASSIRQQRQAELLQKRIRALRSLERMR